MTKHKSGTVHVERVSVGDTFDHTTVITIDEVKAYKYTDEQLAIIGIDGLEKEHNVVFGEQCRALLNAAIERDSLCNQSE